MISTLKWLLFEVERASGFVLPHHFFAPVIPGVSKIPTVATLAAPSFVPALASGVCFTWKVESLGRFKRVLLTPPLMVCIVVVGLSAVPLVIGWTIGNGTR